MVDETARTHPWVRRATTALAVGALGAAALATPAAAGDAPSADLSVSVGHSPGTVKATETVTFTLTASNAGPDTAEAVVVGLGFDYPLRYVELPENCEGALGNQSVICDLGDLASGAQAQVSVDMQPYSSGLFTLPVAVASATNDPDTSNNSITDTLLASKAVPQAERYISGIFPIILDRDPRSAALAFWANRWKSVMFYGGRDQAKIPAGIMASNEYRRIRIRDSYERILGRSADPSGLASWVARAAGGMSFERIEHFLLGSGEFARANAGNEVSAVFQAVLGRAPTSAEAAVWQARVDAGLPSSYLGASLQRTTEGYDLVINDRYQQTFGEGPDDFGRYIWQVRLRQGATPERLWSELLVSPQFLADYPLTDDDYQDYYEAEYDFADQAGALTQALDDAS